MSGRVIDPAVLASIKLGRQEHLNGPYDCGCEQRRERWWLCQYHDGFSDGYESAAASVARNETP